ncbi:hypothetical protein [Absidia glauca]|uniref:Uncharacterized protein n=1 Tax=Absidia glauca TaxID=4829 RepID=A0A168SSJ3_ABSGL|nr:hypothetical protein [Absidia glauca]
MQLPLLIEVPMYPPPTPPAPTGIMSRLWYGLGSLCSSLLGLPAQEGAFYCGLEKRTPNPDFFWPALPPCPGDDGNDSDDSDIYVTCDSGDDDDDEETPARQGLLDLTNASSKRKGRHGNGDEDPERRVSKRPRLFVNINKRKTMEDENDDNDHAAKRQHLD